MVFNNKKKLAKVKIIKMAIDNLINDLEKEESEEKQAEYIKTLYKDAMF